MRLASPWRVSGRLASPAAAIVRKHKTISERASWLGQRLSGLGAGSSARDAASTEVAVFYGFDDATAQLLETGPLFGTLLEGAHISREVLVLNRLFEPA